ncbi:hypothetical protein [Nocardioides conyzicola]|uniref:Uncharacterized protein n=1 Tax=Nocardioides conyzicola TaxID=1651781 RepID=A0ABP8X5S7_9ACTN
MSSPSPSVAARPLRPGGVLVVAAEPLRTLEALGAAFDDVLLARWDRVRADLDEAATARGVVIVVDGVVPADVRELVVDHVTVHSGVLLALGVPRENASLGGVDSAGLKIIGGGRLGELPVTWWAAADLGPVDPRDLPGGSAAAVPGGSSIDPDAFGAHAEILRSGLELARVERPTATDEAAGSSAPRRAAAAPVPAAPPPPGRRRLAVAALAVGGGTGVLAGLGLARIASDPLAAVTLVAVAAILLVLAWGVLAIRRLTARVEEQAARTRRIRKDLERGLRQLTRRAQVIDARGLRMRDTLGEIEARLAVVSTRTSDARRGQANAPYDGAAAIDGGDR